jgi:NifU-like protein involved in Fe-S cluster formation
MFSETVQRILANPTHLGPMEGATHCGLEGVPGEGAFMQIWLEVGGAHREEGRVEREEWDAGTGGSIEVAHSETGRQNGCTLPSSLFPCGAVIVRAAFRTFGCPSATACGSMICTILTGRSVEKAMLLTAEDLLRILGGLPEGKEYCAGLAVSALRAALGSG